MMAVMEHTRARTSDPFFLTNNTPNFGRFKNQNRTPHKKPALLPPKTPLTTTRTYGTQSRTVLPERNVYDLPNDDGFVSIPAVVQENAGAGHDEPRTSSFQYPQDSPPLFVGPEEQLDEIDVALLQLGEHSDGVSVRSASSRKRPRENDGSDDSRSNMLFPQNNGGIEQAPKRRGTAHRKLSEEVRDAALQKLSSRRAAKASRPHDEVRLGRARHGKQSKKQKKAPRRLPVHELVTIADLPYDSGPESDSSQPLELLEDPISPITESSTLDEDEITQVHLKLRSSRGFGKIDIRMFKHPKGLYLSVDTRPTHGRSSHSDGFEGKEAEPSGRLMPVKQTTHRAFQSHKIPFRAKALTIVPERPEDLPVMAPRRPPKKPRKPRTPVNDMVSPRGLENNQMLLDNGDIEHNDDDRSISGPQLHIPRLSDPPTPVIADDPNLTSDIVLDNSSPLKRKSQDHLGHYNVRSLRRREQQVEQELSKVTMKKPHLPSSYSEGANGDDGRDEESSSESGFEEELVNVMEKGEDIAESDGDSDEDSAPHAHPTGSPVDLQAFTMLAEELEGKAQAEHVRVREKLGRTPRNHIPNVLTSLRTMRRVAGPMQQPVLREYDPESSWIPSAPNTQGAESQLNEEIVDSPTPPQTRAKAAIARRSTSRRRSSIRDQSLYLVDERPKDEMQDTSPSLADESQPHSFILGDSQRFVRSAAPEPIPETQSDEDVREAGRRVLVPQTSYFSQASQKLAEPARSSNVRRSNSSLARVRFAQPQEQTDEGSMAGGITMSAAFQHTVSPVKSSASRLPSLMEKTPKHQKSLRTITRQASVGLGVMPGSARKRNVSLPFAPPFLRLSQLGSQTS